MADEDEVRFHGLEPGTPALDVANQVLIERIAWRPVNEKQLFAVQVDVTGDGHPRQKTHVPPVENSPMYRPCRCRKIAISGAAVGRYALSDGVIVVAADDDRILPANPIQAGNRIGPVIDEIADEQTRVKRFANRRQRRPVRMDVRQYQDFHGVRRDVEATSGGRRTLLRSLTLPARSPVADFPLDHTAYSSV